MLSSTVTPQLRSVRNNGIEPYVWPKCQVNVQVHEANPKWAVSLNLAPLGKTAIGGLAAQDRPLPAQSAAYAMLDRSDGLDWMLLIMEH